MSSRTKMLNLQQQMSRHNSWISIIFDKNCVWTINLWDHLKGIIWSQHTYNNKKNSMKIYIPRVNQNTISHCVPVAVGPSRFSHKI